MTVGGAIVLMVHANTSINLSQAGLFRLSVDRFPVLTLAREEKDDYFYVDNLLEMSLRNITSFGEAARTQSGLCSILGSSRR